MYFFQAPPPPPKKSASHFNDCTFFVSRLAQVCFVKKKVTVLFFAFFNYTLSFNETTTTTTRWLTRKHQQC